MPIIEQANEPHRGKGGAAAAERSPAGVPLGRQLPTIVDAGVSERTLLREYLATYICDMAQITFYLPTDALELARKCASDQRLSLSAWVTNLVRDATVTHWPADFRYVVGYGGENWRNPAIRCRNRSRHGLDLAAGQAERG